MKILVHLKKTLKSRSNTKWVTTAYAVGYTSKLYLKQCSFKAFKTFSSPRPGFCGLRKRCFDQQHISHAERGQWHVSENCCN